jgi:hypothetical protein
VCAIVPSRSRFPRFLILALVLASLLTAFPGTPATAQGVASPEVAASQAVATASGTAADGVIVEIVAQEGGWAYGTATIPAGGEHDAPEVFFFLAHDDGASWFAELRFTPGFDTLLAQAPAAFPSPEIRGTLDGFTIAGDGSADMAFPFPVGQAWQFNGPHPNSGGGAWSSLDFYPPSLTANAPVNAMRGGVVYRPCANLVVIDHGDGWQSHYYHLINISVSQGQVVSRGQQIGGTSAEFKCGGAADGPHLHIWLEYQNNEMVIAGMDIGGWTVENGSAPYQGCLFRDGVRLCRSNFARVLNDGLSGSGGGTATGSPAVSLNRTRTTVNTTVAYSISGYPANATVQITWRRLSGSTIDMGTARTNSAGNATGSFRVPATPGGPNQQISFTAGSVSETVLFEVAPRIKVLTNPAVRGQQANVSLRGYARQESVRIRWRQPDGRWVELARITTSNTGSANVMVAVPAWAPDGTNSVRGDGTEFRQQTNAVYVSGGSFRAASVADEASPTPTVTATPVTIDTSALPTEPPLPIVTVTDDASDQPVTVVTDQNPDTFWQADPARGTAMLTVDLGAPSTLSAVAWLEMQTGCGTIDRIEASTDGENWTLLTPDGPVVTGDAGVWQVLPVSLNAQYIRWIVSAVEGETGLGCLAEATIWGTPLPTPEPEEAATEPPAATEPAPTEPAAPTETATPEPTATGEPAEAPAEMTETSTETASPPDASEESGEP